MKQEKLQQLMDKYQSLGVMMAGELLLYPQDALQFLDDLAIIRVRILGVDLWYFVKDLIAEDLACLDLSSYAVESPDQIDQRILAAKQFIRFSLPIHTDLVSFVLDI